MKTAAPKWISKRRIVTHSDFDYQSSKWFNFSKEFKKANPLCAECQRYGKLKFGMVSDHIVGIKNGGSVYDKRNLQNLCKKHDQQKRYRESNGQIISGYELSNGLIPSYSVENILPISSNKITDLSKLSLNNKTVFIVGAPASGKTTISLIFKERLVLHTDDFIKDQNTLIYRLNTERNYIAEGNLLYELIDIIKRPPDIIIEMQATFETVTERYRRHRDIRNLLYAMANHYTRQRLFYNTIKRMKPIKYYEL
jgi:hypothetical protein